jgi:hypothetical protein
MTGYIFSISRIPVANGPLKWVHNVNISVLAKVLIFIPKGGGGGGSLICIIKAGLLSFAHYRK